MGIPAFLSELEFLRDPEDTRPAHGRDEQE